MIGLLIEGIVKKLLNNKQPTKTKVKKKKLVRKTIKILDSNQIIPGKLRNLAKEFNCKELKGHFPYKFININNLKHDLYASFLIS